MRALTQCEGMAIMARGVLIGQPKSLLSQRYWSKISWFCAAGLLRAWSVERKQLIERRFLKRAQAQNL